MKMTEADWERLQPHVGTADHQLPPRAVYATLAALTTNETITASWADIDASEEQSTLWTHWFVTENTIGCTTLKFAAADYDLTEEDNGRFNNTSIPFEVQNAWVRPLSSIRLFMIGTVKPLVRQGENWWSAITNVKIEFSGGDLIELPNPGNLYQPEDRARWDDFVSVVKAAIAR